MNSTWYEGFAKEKQRKAMRRAASAPSETFPQAGSTSLPDAPMSRSSEGFHSAYRIRSQGETGSTFYSSSSDFHDRANNHNGYKKRLEMSTVQKQLFKDCRNIDDVEFWGAQGVRGFRIYLKKVFGSIIAGWRALDLDRNGRLSFYEFCNACRRMGYHGNLKQLWKQLDVNLNGFVSLAEIDPVAGQALGTFKLHLMKHYGDMLTAWTTGLDKNGSGRIEEHEIRVCLKEMGLNLDAEKLFSMLRMGRGGKGVTLADFSPDAAQRFYTSDFKGLLSGPDTEFLEDLHGIGQEFPWPEDIVNHPATGGAREWRLELENRDKAKWQDRIAAVKKLGAGIQTPDGFRKALVMRCGSLLGAWNQALDLDGNGRLTFGEFCHAVRRLGYEGNLKALFAELDADGKGVILFQDIDKETDEQLTDLRAKLLAKHENMIQAWINEFDKDRTGCVTEERFLRACKSVAYAGDAKKLFKHMQPESSRTFLTLKDFDTKAYMALCRGDFRMITEKEGFNRHENYHHNNLSEMSFDERMTSGFYHQIRRAWNEARREEFAKAVKTANAPEHLADSAEDFKVLCVRKYGSMLKAWRDCLDWDHNGKLTFNEFCGALRRLGYAGDFRALWYQFDVDRRGFLSLEDLDKESNELITSFLKLLGEKYGDLDNAWREGFGKDPHDSIDLAALTKVCGELAYPHDVSKLFKQLQPLSNHSKHMLSKGMLLGITIWNIDPQCSRKRARGDKADIIASKAKGSPVSPSGMKEASHQLAVNSPARALQQAMKTKYGSTATAWRAAFDPNGLGSVSFTAFMRGAQDISYQGNFKQLWQDFGGQTSSRPVETLPKLNSITFREIDADGQAALDEARQAFIQRFGSLRMAWQKEFHPSKETVVHEANFVSSCGKMVKKPNRLFRLIRGYPGQSSLTCDDFKCALLLGVPPTEHDKQWAGESNIDSPQSSLTSPSQFRGQWSSCQDLQHRSRIEGMAESENRLDLVIDSIAAFKSMLTTKYGSVFSAWGRVLDTDRNGFMSRNEFTKACQNHGVRAIRRLWMELGEMGDLKRVSFKDLDPETAEAFEEFEKLLILKYGTALQGWRQCFEKPAPANVTVDEEKFVRQCNALGYRGDARMLFKATRPDPGINVRTYEDLWYHAGPKGVNGTPGQDLPGPEKVPYKPLRTASVAAKPRSQGTRVDPVWYAKFCPA